MTPFEKSEAAMFVICVALFAVAAFVIFHFVHKFW